MAAYDLCNLTIVINVSKDLLTDLRVALHFPALVECECAGFLEQTSRKSNLSDVVNQAAKVNQLPFAVR